MKLLMSAIVALSVTAAWSVPAAAQ